MEQIVSITLRNKMSQQDEKSQEQEQHQDLKEVSRQRKPLADMAKVFADNQGKPREEVEKVLAKRLRSQKRGK